MGLDSYLGKRDADGVLGPADDLDWPVTNMVGGMFSGNGDGSFRGKAYDYLFTVMTGGDSLYHEAQPAKWVKQKADEMEAYLANDPQFPGEEWPSWNEEEEATKLATIFRFAADNDLEYGGWW